MNAIRFRHATLWILLAAGLPAVAQDVRYEYRGEAYNAGLLKEDTEAAIARQVAGAVPVDKAQIVFFRPARTSDAETLSSRFAKAGPSSPSCQGAAISSWS